MGSAAAGLLLAATLVIALACVGAWYVLRRPTRQLERRRRDEALAAASRYTPAQRAPAYGQPPTAPEAAPDPSAPGLDDAARVAAMRKLLQPGTAPGPSAGPVDRGDATVPGPRDDDMATTSPMAWKPTLPCDADFTLVAPKRGSTRQRAQDADHDHVTLS